MFDSKDGPVLGEFTPFSANGKADPLPSCVMSYLFVAHSKHAGLTDDAKTLSSVEKHLGKKANTEVLNHPDNFDFSPPEAYEWLQHEELIKCKKVMDAQHELNQKQKG